MGRVRQVLVGAAMLLGAVAAWAHPDLVVQIDDLTVRLAASPDDTELLLKRGDLYRRHQDYTAAARDFDRAAEVSPGEPLLDFYRGRLQQETGHPEQADPLLARYLENHPEQASAWKLRGEVALSLNDPARSAAYFSEAISLSSAPSPDLYRLLVMAQVAAGGQYWPAAMQNVDQGLNRYGLEVTLLGLGTDIALASGQPERAAGWINALPPKLLTLPQWEARADLLDCFQLSPEPTCQAQAVSKLRQQTENFMRHFHPGSSSES